MRRTLQAATLAVLALGLTAGKKAKDKDNSETPPAEPEAAAPATMDDDDTIPEPDAEPAPQAAATPNADFNAKITHADGSTKSGHVVRVERSEDWYAEEGWTDKTSKLTVTVEGNGTEKDVEWTAIKSIDVSYLGKSNIDCTYDSEYTPLMWTCTMQTKSTVALAEGGSWSAIGRHKWRFTFADGSSDEFWVYKLPARQQEDSVADLDTPGGNEVVNAELQVALQDAVIKASTGSAVKRVEISK